MRIGLVGKPNVGKSTFFSAATLAQVDIANYPFCTIDPNVGVAFVEARLPCPCKDLREKLEADGRIEPATDEDPRKGSLCEPRTGVALAIVAPYPLRWSMSLDLFQEQVRVADGEMHSSPIWPIVMF